MPGLTVNLQQLRWQTYQSGISNLMIQWYTAPIVKLGVYWNVGDTLPIHINVPIQALLWKIGLQIDNLHTLQWETGQVKSLFTPIVWNVSSLAAKNVGLSLPSFYTRQTGEPNSPQVIRIRSAINIHTILYETTPESLVNGFISFNAQLDNFQNPTTMILTDNKLSNYTLTGQAPFTNRGGQTQTRIGLSSLPGNVFHEYKSTTDISYIIRYLGYLPRNPEKAFNGILQKYDARAATRFYGATILGINNKGFPVTLNIHRSDGKLLSGILPVGAAIVMCRFSDTDYRIGYINSGVISGSYNPNSAAPYDTIKQNIRSIRTGILMSS